MENTYCVYCHVSPNGKMYIGITSKKPEKRWCNGIGYKRNTYFWNAIQKYGWDAFEHQILFSGLSREEASKVETDLISKLNTTNSENGYNFASGGFGGAHPISEETKKKISDFHKGRPCSESKKRHLSEVNKGKMPTNIDAIHKRNQKPVDQFDLDGNYIATFPSIRIAGIECNACENGIGLCCRGHNKTCGGYVWRFSV